MPFKRNIVFRTPVRFPVSALLDLVVWIGGLVFKEGFVPSTGTRGSNPKPPSIRGELTVDWWEGSQNRVTAGNRKTATVAILQR